MGVQIRAAPRMAARSKASTPSAYFQAFTVPIDRSATRRRGGQRRCEYRRCHSPCRREVCRDDIMKLHERIIAFDLVGLAAGDIESQRVAFGVRAEVDFGREAAARAAERFLILIPPFTPAACWCARTIVESIACSVVGGRSKLAKVSNAASHTPSLLQRVKRTKTEFQLPYRSGMSRQGAPVREHPENAVDRSPLVRDRRTAFATIGKQWIENAPFRVRQIAAT